MGVFSSCSVNGVIGATTAEVVLPWLVDVVVHGKMLGTAPSINSRLVGVSRNWVGMKCKEQSRECGVGSQSFNDLGDTPLRIATSHDDNKDLSFGNLDQTK